LDNPQAPVDLSTLFPIDIALKSYIRGYVGTNTVPNCERGVCWYFLGEPQPISQAQLDKLKIPGVASNNRGVHEKRTNYKQYDAQGMYYTPQ